MALVARATCYWIILCSCVGIVPCGANTDNMFVVNSCSSSMTSIQGVSTRSSTAGGRLYYGKSSTKPLCGWTLVIRLRLGGVFTTKPNLGGEGIDSAITAADEITLTSRASTADMSHQVDNRGQSSFFNVQGDFQCSSSNFEAYFDCYCPDSPNYATACMDTEPPTTAEPTTTIATTTSTTTTITTTTTPTTTTKPDTKTTSTTPEMTTITTSTTAEPTTTIPEKTSVTTTAATTTTALQGTTTTTTKPETTTITTTQDVTSTSPQSTTSPTLYIGLNIPDPTLMFIRKVPNSCYNGLVVTTLTSPRHWMICASECVPERNCVGVNEWSDGTRCDLVLDLNVDGNLGVSSGNCQFYRVVWKA